MRQAILTKYLGPTNSRGARIKATCDAGSKVIAWDYADNPFENHQNAAIALANSFHWASDCDLIPGCLPGNKGYVFVLVDRKGP